MRRRIRALLLCTTCAGLFLLSLAFTTAAFYLFHIFSTRPLHLFSLPLAISTSSLSGNISLKHSRIRSIHSISIYVRLDLPESAVNLDNSVFSVHTELYSSTFKTSSCLAESSAHGALQFRSPVRRAIRAALLFVPMSLGFAHEYQSLRIHALSYAAYGQSPKLDNVHVTISPSVLQVASATLEVHVKRRMFLRTLIEEHQWPLLFLITAGLWYTSLISLTAVMVVASALRRLFSALWSRRGAQQTSVQVGEDKRSVSEILESKSESSSATRVSRAGSSQRTVSETTSSQSRAWGKGLGLRRRIVGS